jgi:hypothetical protein
MASGYVGIDRKSFDLFTYIQIGYLTDISMHTLVTLLRLDLWIRYHDKILLEYLEISCLSHSQAVIQSHSESHSLTLRGTH